MIEKVFIAVFSLAGAYFLGIYRNRRSRLFEFRQFIARLIAELEDSENQDLITFFLANKPALRNMCAIATMDITPWKKRKFDATFKEIINLKENDIIDDKVRDQLIHRGSYPKTGPHTPIAEFPGRKRMNTLLNSLLKLAS